MNIQTKNKDMEGKHLLNTLLFFLPNEEQNENMTSFHSAWCGMNSEALAGANRKDTNQKVRKMEDIDPEAELEPHQPHNAQFKPLTLDIDKHRKHVTQFELSEAEQIELLETVWHLMVKAVDCGIKITSRSENENVDDAGIDFVELLFGPEENNKNEGT